MKSSSKINKYHLHQHSPLKRQFECFDLQAYINDNLEHSSKPHSHSYYQLIWFNSNEGHHIVDFKSFEIKRDRLFFIAKNQVHFFEKGLDYQGELLHFNESFLLQNENDIDFFINYHLFNNLNAPYFQIPLNLTNEFRIYINQIKNELANEDSFGHQSILAQTLKSFLIKVEREKRKMIPAIGNLNSSLTFLKFRKLLESYYQNNWTVSRYADELNISSKTLNSLVKKNTGKTTSALIKARIVLEAKRQLSYSDAFVNEIGYKLGFQDPSYFVKFFKKQVKLTPSEFRNAIS